MEQNPKVDEFIAKHPQWEKELTKMVKIIRRSKLEETIKWGRPTFCLNGKLIFGIGAFKNHFGIWYFQGALLKDEAEVLINVQTGKTIAMRQWKFTSMKEINSKLIHAYNQEAIANERAGKKVVTGKRIPKMVLMPAELEEFLQQNNKMNTAYNALSKGKQNEIKTYIDEAKRSATRKRRLEKCIELLKEGKTPMDKYRK